MISTGTLAPVPAPNRTWQQIGLALAILTGVRVLLAFLLPLGTDEAYAITVSRGLFLSYFDHPPLHFWMIGLWQDLTGAASPGVLRLPFVLAGTLAAALLSRAAENLFGALAGLWTVVLVGIAPVFGAAHGLMILPDSPLLAAGAGLLLALTPLAHGNPLSSSRWLVAGFAAGLALLSKYHGALMIAGALIFLLSTPAGRRSLLTPGPWLAALVATLALVPVLVWNAQNGWASFAFQSSRGQLQEGLDILAILRSVVVQSLYLGPWILVPLAFAVMAGLRPPPRLGQLLPLSLGLPIVFVFTLAAATGRGLPHWPMPGWFLMLPVLGHAIAAASAPVRRLAVAGAIAAALFWTSIALAVSAQTRSASFDGVFAALGIADPSPAVVPWDALRVPLERLAADDPRTFVAATNWIDAARLGAAIGDRWPVLCLCADARHFQYLNPPQQFAGWTGLVVARPTRSTLFEAGSFTSLSQPQDVSLVRAGRVILPLAIWRGTGFVPAP